MFCKKNNSLSACKFPLAVQYYLHACCNNRRHTYKIPATDNTPNNRTRAGEPVYPPHVPRRRPDICVAFGESRRAVQQTTDNRQQTTDNRQQTTDNRQQTTDNRQQTNFGSAIGFVKPPIVVFSLFYHNSTFRQEVYLSINNPALEATSSIRNKPLVRFYIT
jgi:hypothetical protein